MARFKSLVRGGEKVTEAVYDAGFGSTSRLYENAAVQLGMTPATYRKGGAGATIRYVTTDSELGGSAGGGHGDGRLFGKIGRRL